MSDESGTDAAEEREDLRFRRQFEVERAEFESVKDSTARIREQGDRPSATALDPEE